MNELWTALVLGVLHSVEPDHLAAVTSYTVRTRDRREAAGYGLRWAIGHGGVVLVAGTLLVLLPIQVGDGVGVWLERIVGASLVLLGAWVLITARALHVHTHRHGDGTDHVHLHAHPAGRHDIDEPGDAAAHRHRHGATAFGALHGLAGTAPAVALLPLVQIDAAPAAFAYLAVFGLGTAGAMVLYALAAGAATGRAAERSGRLARGLARTAGLGTIAVGIWWMLG